MVNKTLLKNYAIVIIIIIIVVLVYFLNKKNTIKTANTINTINSVNNLNKKMSNEDSKPWNKVSIPQEEKKNICQKYKKDYFDTCQERYNKNIISESAYKSCIVFAEGYYNCNNIPST